MNRLERKEGGAAGPARVYGVPALCLMLAVLGACTAMHPAPTPPVWRCDPAVDALVENGQWEEALAGHEQLLRATPDNCLALYHVGYILGHLGERLNEVRVYEQAVACGYTRDDRLYFNMGMAYADLGDLERATEALERAVDLNADNADNFFGLALIAGTAGRQADAERALRHAITVDPGHLEARLELANLYLNQGRWDDARAHLDAAGAVDPGNEEVRLLRQLLESRRAAEYER